jgi:hypothetical protein
MRQQGQNRLISGNSSTDNQKIHRFFFHPVRALETSPFTAGRNALSFLSVVAHEYPYPSAL